MRNSLYKYYNILYALVSYYEKIGSAVRCIDEELPFELPEGWSVASFSQINLFQSESVDPSTVPEEMFELYSVPNYELNTPEIILGKDIGSTKQLLQENDILVCKINPRINRVWVSSHITPYRIIGSSEWITVRNSSLYAPFLCLYFKSPFFREFLLSNVSGVGGSLMRAQPESVKKYPILIPPFEEQKRIAHTITKVFNILSNIEKSLS